jgi:uncharacterized protein (TIGR04255 family)
MSLDSVQPDFSDPPVIEVALSLQFMPLEAFRIPHYGLLREAFRAEGLSRFEEHGVLPQNFETFDSNRIPRIAFSVQTFDDAPPLPRLWLINDAGNELVQIQPDRLIVNWRKGAEDEAYPRYTSVLARFERAVATFEKVVASENLGTVVPSQCEVTYVNHIVSGHGWITHGEADQILTVWQNKYSDDFLTRPEDSGFAARFLIGEDRNAPQGRLHVNFQPAFRSTDGRPMYVLTLVARGAPLDQTSSGVLKFLNLGHQYVIRGFTSLTTSHMHAIWGRKHGRS